MVHEARLLVVSCPHRRPIQDIWNACQKAHWPDCPFPIDMLSPEPDLGWNANLIQYLETVSEELILLLLDDHFVEQAPPGECNTGMAVLLQLMAERPDIAMVKLQAGNAHPPELPFPAWDRLREYDRAHHPFKRTNLVPTLFRKSWLQRLTRQILQECGTAGDQGRPGALHFEVSGTLLTEDAVAWPERMLGIHRPNPDGGGGRSLLTCIANDGVREGRLQIPEEKRRELLERSGFDVNAVSGIEAFL
jgi:hypothetical protein